MCSLGHSDRSAHVEAAKVVIHNEHACAFRVRPQTNDVIGTALYYWVWHAGTRSSNCATQNRSIDLQVCDDENRFYVLSSHPLFQASNFEGMIGFHR